MLKKLTVALLYTALSATAIPALAFDLIEVENLREGTMKKLGFHAEVRDVSPIAFEALDGETETLSDYSGQWVVVNFWATWCAPCRKEMPALDALSKEFSEQGLKVLPIATGRNPVAAVTKFYGSANIETLPIRLDPKGQLARDMGVLGLPVTLILDPQGHEVARMTGDADWFSPSARSIIETLLITNADLSDAPIQ